MCALVLKRGRGRPRLNESREYNDSDVQLINEFKKRRPLFDRTHTRDRENVERLWQEMAEILNTPVPAIKERTTQLRNRYNIEKRRIELQIEQGEPVTKSPWPLYEHLSFLSEHIKPRRAIALSRPSTPNPPPRAVKKLRVLPPEDTTSSEDNEVTYTTVSNPKPLSSVNAYNYYIEKPTNGLNYDQELPSNMNENMYKHFGKFVASSLINMKENDALRLVEKFTTELVQGMHQIHNNT